MVHSSGVLCKERNDQLSICTITCTKSLGSGSVSRVATKGEGAARLQPTPNLRKPKFKNRFCRYYIKRVT